MFLQSATFRAMAVLWLALAAALGALFLHQCGKHRARAAEVRGVLLALDENPLLFLDDSRVNELEKSLFRIPDDPELAAAVSWTLALRTAFLGEDAVRWQRVHALASRMFGRTAVSAVSRIRWAAAPILVKARTADARPQAVAALQEALLVLAKWPFSALARRTAAYAALAAGEEGMARQFLSQHDLPPFSWLLPEAGMTEREKRASGRHETPQDPFREIWMELTACLDGGEIPDAKTGPTDAAGPDAYPEVADLKRLAAACRAVKSGRWDHAAALLRWNFRFVFPRLHIAAMRLALDAGDLEAYGALRDVFVRRYGERHQLFCGLLHVEWMLRFEPELAWEELECKKYAIDGDPMAAAAAIASGHARDLDPHSVPPAFRDFLKLQEPPPGPVLQELESWLDKKPRPVPETVLWLHFSMRSLKPEDWGSQAFDERAEKIRKILSALPQGSRWVSLQAARLGILRMHVAETAKALTALCADGDADYSQNPHFCTGWIADPEVRNLYGRYLTAEELHSVSPAWVEGWLAENVPMQSPQPGASLPDADWFWQLRRRRFDVRLTPGHARDMRKQVEAWRLEKHENMEIRTEYALLLLALGDARPAVELAQDPALPAFLARRLIFHLIQAEHPAQLQLAERYAARDLTPAAHMEFERLLASARLASGRDAVPDWERIFAQDPCIESAIMLLHAHLAAHSKNCSRMKEILSGFAAQPQLEGLRGQIQRICP